MYNAGFVISTTVCLRVWPANTFYCSITESRTDICFVGNQQLNWHAVKIAFRSIYTIVTVHKAWRYTRQDGQQTSRDQDDGDRHLPRYGNAVQVCTTPSPRSPHHHVHVLIHRYCTQFISDKRRNARRKSHGGWFNFNADSSGTNTKPANDQHQKQPCMHALLNVVTTVDSTSGAFQRYASYFSLPHPWASSMSVSHQYADLWHRTAAEWCQSMVE